jgi:uncharacterized protein YjbJ (UPF0337 family)
MADPKEQKGKGKWDKIKGRAQEAWGAATGSEEDRLKGQGKQVKGEARDTAGDIREKLKG